MTNVSSGGGMIGGLVGFGVIFVLFLVLLIIPFWKVFTKAGQSGWKSIVPVYNTYVMTVIAGLPWYFFIGFFIPVVGLAVAIAVNYHISLRFGHGMGFAIGMTFLPFIFWPILGYGASTYNGAPMEVNTPTVPVAPAVSAPIQTQ